MIYFSSIDQEKILLIKRKRTIVHSPKNKIHSNGCLIIYFFTICCLIWFIIAIKIPKITSVCYLVYSILRISFSLQISTTPSNSLDTSTLILSIISLIASPSISPCDFVSTSSICQIVTGYLSLVIGTDLYSL